MKTQSGSNDSLLSLAISSLAQRLPEAALLTGVLTEREPKRPRLTDVFDDVDHTLFDFDGADTVNSNEKDLFWASLQDLEIPQDIFPSGTRQPLPKSSTPAVAADLGFKQAEDAASRGLVIAHQAASESSRLTATLVLPPSISGTKRTREQSQGSDDSSAQDECSSTGSDASSTQQRFHAHHKCLWMQKYKELVEYKQQAGHCCVPKDHDVALNRWIKRQRYQWKRMQEGRESTITQERIEALNALGFVWNYQEVSWHRQLAALKEFRKSRGHANVPSNHRDSSLSMWVKCQRRQYRLLKEGKASNMTPERIAELEAIQFEWSIRRPKVPSSTGC